MRRRIILYNSLVEKAKKLSSGTLGTGLLVGHNTISGGENDDTELTRREQIVGPLLNL